MSLSSSTPLRFNYTPSFKLTDYFRQIFHIRVSDPDPKQRSLVHIARCAPLGFFVGISFANELDRLYIWHSCDCHSELFLQLHVHAWAHYRVDETPKYDFLVFGIALAHEAVGTMVVERPPLFASTSEEYLQMTEAMAQVDPLFSASQSTSTQALEIHTLLALQKGVIAQDVVLLCDIPFKYYQPQGRCTRLHCARKINGHIPMTRIYAIVQVLNDEYKYYLRHLNLLVVATVLSFVTGSRKLEPDVGRMMAGALKQAQKDFATFDGIPVTAPADIIQAVVDRVGPKAVILEETMIREMELRKTEVNEEVCKMKEEEAQKDEEARRVNEESAKAHEKLAKAHEELAKVNEKLAKADEKLAKADEELTKLNEEMTKLNEEMTKLNDRARRAKEELTKTKEELAKKKEGTKRSAEELQHMKGEANREP